MTQSLKFRIALLAMTTAFTLGNAAEPAVLPTLSFDNLNKAHITLPADFHSDRDLLLLYFDLTQQPDIDAWNSEIEQWRTHDPSLTAYTSLVSPQKNFLSRWWQNASLRSATPDASHWDTTVPIYVDKHAFERKLSIGTEKQVVVLLLDRQGHVLARVSGPPTGSSQDALLTALHSAGSPLTETKGH